VAAIRPCSHKSLADLSREWDGLAKERHRQIESREDLSFHHVVVPTAFRLIEGSNIDVVLDIGSGTGDFTVQLARIAKQIVAVEPSSASMAVARTVCRGVLNVRQIEESLEAAVANLSDVPVTAAVALMSLMTVPDLKHFARSLATVMPSRAKFSAVLTHPCFWPKYWGYDGEPWFRYERETFIEAPFKISRCTSTFTTTHIHRPIEQYVEVFAEYGFRLELFVEPVPAPEVQALYPIPWRFPRFLGVRWEKID
jgi:SAM-dependent methyltransferase